MVEEGFARVAAAYAALSAQVTAGLAAVLAWTFAGHILSCELGHACVLDRHFAVPERNRVAEVVVFT